MEANGQLYSAAERAFGDHCVACCLVLSAIPDSVCRAGSSVPFRTLCVVLLGPQCHSGRCVSCSVPFRTLCAVLSAVPDAMWTTRLSRTWVNYSKYVPLLHRTKLVILLPQSQQAHCNVLRSNVDMARGREMTELYADRPYVCRHLTIKFNQDVTDS
jgi:hypothetical protein